MADKHTPSEMPGQNTDREIWREREGDYYADRIYVTQYGYIGIDCGGHCIVLPVRQWHALAHAQASSGRRTPPKEPTDGK